jgi:hypothetical protein
MRAILLDMGPLLKKISNSSPHPLRISKKGFLIQGYFSEVAFLFIDIENKGS